MSSPTRARWAITPWIRRHGIAGRHSPARVRVLKVLYWWSILEAASCAAEPDPTRTAAPSPTGDTTTDDDPIRTDGDGDGDDQGAGDGDGDGTGPGDGGGQNVGGICEEQILRSQGVIPEMLIVLDRSGSMKTLDVNRWDPSVAAVTEVTANLDARAKFGLMVFPGIEDPTQNCVRVGNSVSCSSQSNSVSCDAGTLEVPVGLHQAAAIDAALSKMSPFGGTPTSATLAEAGKVLGSTSSDPDAMVTPRYVLLVTDGAPNCADVAASDAPDLENTVKQIEQLAAQGTHTYVIGYNTQADLKPAMDMMAAAGDTGSTEHIAVENQQSLQQALEGILGKATSCAVRLDKAPNSRSYVAVTLDQTTLKLDDPNGFSLSMDGRTVTVLGKACEDLAASSQRTVRVKVACEPPIL
ncbi:MAG: VWA domain-containing protein [Myxococcales bacterium]